MGKSIEDYREKRDFARSPEPEAAPPSEREGAPIFVVHRHDASRLHYDLRLEMDGVLRSWAVPKGFSYDPDEKHLAVRTEDHPLEYEHFDGVIPKGEYGAGTMTIWDRGRYEVLKADSGSEAVAKGELKLLLRGRKLRGEWHLVRTKKDKNEELWLLFKSRDRYAGTPRDSALGIDLSAAEEAPLPENVVPMTIGATAEPFSDPDWLFEMKFTGRRVLARKRGEEVALLGSQVMVGVTALDQELRKIRAENALVDGVLVCADDSERPSRALLEERLTGKNDRPLQLYAFDLLYYDEFDLRALPTVDRKAALRAVLPPLPSVLFVDHVPGNGESLCQAVAAAGLPAAVAKRADAPYTAGPSDT